MDPRLALDDLVRGFEQRTLTKAQWTHEAHLRVGLWLVAELGLDRAVPRLRDGIRRLNETLGTANTDSSGYHETITLFYAWALDEHLRRHHRDLEEAHDAMDGSKLHDRTLLSRWWSRELLRTVDARRGWMPPDAAALPPGIAERLASLARA